MLSGLLLYASFPPLEQPFLAWIALVPILTALSYTRYLKAFLMGFLMGMVFCALHIWWLNVVPDLPFVSFIAIALYIGVFFGLFGLFFCMTARRTRWPKVLVAPALWVAMEFLRSNLSFLAIPWGLLGHSQHGNVAIIQIASITSVYGISFLIVLVNAAFAEGLLWILNHRIGMTTQQPPKKAVFSSIVVPLTAVLIVYLWGGYQVRMLDKNKNGILSASVIQGNIAQNDKWNPKYRKMIIQRYLELTLLASQENPDLIIWPETATPRYLLNDHETYLTVRDLVRETGAPLLLGSGSHAKINRGGKKVYNLKNTAFLMDRNGKIVSHYDKMRLLPFGEYLPLEGRFPWPRWLVPKNGVFTPGASHEVFELHGARFGVVICWENLFPGLFRKFVKEGAEFMVNLTNEAWFEKTAASRQILSMSVFRAVENRVSLLRSANTGISSLVDPLGMVTGTLTVSVPEPIGETFYTRHGDVFAVLCTLLAILFIVTASLPPRIRRVLKVSEPR
jgi:apolipoprotein N-acyltransferase